jgi:hypothetical protein
MRPGIQPDAELENKISVDQTPIVWNFNSPVGVTVCGKHAVLFSNRRRQSAMRSARFTSFITAIAALGLIAQLSGCVSHDSRAAADTAKPSDDSVDLPVKEEIRKTYQLTPGARVEVGGIDGSVDVETTEAQTAEVYIVRSARDQQTLEEGKTTIVAEADSLSIRNDHGNSQGLWAMLKGGGDLRTRVRLRLPRKVKLDVGGVNGPVTIGEIDGAVEVSGVNGKISIAQTLGATAFSGVNGPIEITIRDLGKDGIEASGINGPIDLRFVGEVNADLEVSGLNGVFNDEGVNAVLEEKHDRHNFTGKIGAGGSPISFAGINGPITLAKSSAPMKNVSGASAK